MGSAGTILTSAGSGNTPTWSTPANTILANPAAKVWLTSNTGQSVTNGTFGSTIASGGFTVGYQKGSMTATSSAVITVPVTGIYLINAGLNTTAGAAGSGTLQNITVNVNGTSVAEARSTGVTNDYIGINVTTMHACSATNTITFSYYVNAGSTNTFKAGEDSTWLSVALISN
jgi:hypothetical protein